TLLRDVPECPGLRGRVAPRSLPPSAHVLPPAPEPHPLSIFPARPLILGHRGAPRQAPENTLAAFRLALEQGADGVELDVQPSGDGVAVVIHDDTLQRTTDAAGAIPMLPWERIAAARARGEPVPRLEEAARWAAETGAWLNVEIKSSGAEAAALVAVREAGIMERAFFSSFLPEVVAEVGRLDPEATRCFLTERWNDQVRATAARLEVHGVCLKDRIATAAVLAELRAKGLAVVVWTVDDARRIAALLRAGVQAVITNQPAVGAGVRREIFARE
ncbi:MAG TPA: glycerophosphodiester phosphodiesterase family protein, partial [Longimicrobiaceae bacterium]|nr:glycerophosphodiester phosphodiesterase family protein [Longimicrobiaceae bacterium]